MSVIIAGALTVIAAIALVITAIWFLYEAFRVHWGWGLACLFVPFAAVVFLFVHWREATKPFVAYLFSAMLFVGGGFLLANQSGMDWREYLPAGVQFSANDDDNPSADNAGTLQAELAKMRQEENNPTLDQSESANATTSATPSPVEAFQSELQQLNDKLPGWYQELMDQRTNLDAKDPTAVQAYNEEAAKYQAAVERQKELDRYLKSLNQ